MVYGLPAGCLFDKMKYQQQDNNHDTKKGDQEQIIGEVLVLFFIRRIFRTDGNKRKQTGKCQQHGDHRSKLIDQGCSGEVGNMEGCNYKQTEPKQVRRCTENVFGSSCFHGVRFLPHNSKSSVCLGTIYLVIGLCNIT